MKEYGKQMALRPGDSSGAEIVLKEQGMAGPFRRIVATVAIVVFVMAYGLIAMELGAVVAALTGTFGQMLYFVIAGLLWVLPAGFLVSWGWKRRLPDAK
jgi:hypothetical protein